MNRRPWDEMASTTGWLRRIGWTRGKGCCEVASLIAGDEPTKIDGDLRSTCIAERIDVLVTRKLTSFDLVPVVVPHDVVLEDVRTVVAAVGDGPHSPLAVEVADRVGSALEVPRIAGTVFRSDDEREPAEERLRDLTEDRPGVEAVAVQGTSAVRLIDDIDAVDESTLLVVGAPGGSWFQRQILGPGHRLAVAAPAGVLTVRSAPRRCFHAVSGDHEAVVGLHMSVTDALRVVDQPVVAVADGGILVGVARRRDLTSASADATMEDVMEPPVGVDAAEPIWAIEDVRDFFEGAPVPVTDGAGRIVGMA